MSVLPDGSVPGAYVLHDDAPPERVHLFQGGNYELAVIAEYLGLGRLDGDGVLTLEARDLRDLKPMADAQSFDHEEGFIEMCYEIDRYVRARGLDRLRLAGNF